MLKYIRKNVRSSFDKAFEDALGRFYNATDAESMKQQWHTMIKDNNFQFTDMANSYASVTPVKAQRLYNLEYSVYPTLPN
jgi:nitrous oxide reductase